MKYVHAYKVFLQRKGRQFWTNWVFHNLTAECLVFEPEGEFGYKLAGEVQGGRKEKLLWNSWSFAGSLVVGESVPLCTHAKSPAARFGLPCLLRLAHWPALSPVTWWHRRWPPFSFLCCLHDSLSDGSH